MISRERLHEADKHAKKRAEWTVGKDNWRHVRKTSKPCSCMMCGNPRKYGELTRQEMRIEQRETFE